VSIAICVASFMGLLLVYGLNTWLPKIMGEAGYSIKAGTGLLLILNVGAVIGLLIAGAIVGPSLGGALVTAGIAYPWGFYAFAIAAVLAVLALATIPAHVDEPVTA
jgi:hypothetical protein